MSEQSDGRQVVIQGHNIKRYYPIRGGPFNRHIDDVQAVDGVNFRITRGETLGLVGESGCGKSTLGRLLVDLDEPTDGHLYFDLPREDADEVAKLESVPSRKRSADDERHLEAFRENYAIDKMTGKRAKNFRRNAQFVFQNPSSSLNPRKLIRDTVARPLELHSDLKGDEIDDRVIELLERVGLGEAHLYRYPHMLSGGQKQRVAIARAIAPNPELVVLDEPTSALDVSVQAQILNLLNELQEQLDLTYLCISHDLSVIRHISDRIYVMYLGQIAEKATRNQLFETPKHPYTEALLSSSPAIETEEQIELEGDVPEPEDPPTGCRFHTRCHRAFEHCGWSGRDLYNLLKRLNSVEETAGMIWSDLEDADHDGYESVFEFGSDPSQYIDDLAGETDTLSSHNPPLFEALEEVSQDGTQIEVSFVTIDPPKLVADGDEQEVACYLYD